MTQMFSRSLKSAFFALAALALTPGLASAQAEFTMKYAIGNPAVDMTPAWTPHLVLKNEIEARSNGRIAVELYPGGQLGGVESTVNQVRQNIIQASDPSEGHFATTYPEIQVFSIPYLFLNRDVAWEVLDGEFGQRMIEDMAAKTGIRPLMWSENGGFRHYSNNVKPIRSPADMAGLKIRTMNSPLHMEIVKNLGASPTPIAWAELYTSLQTGVVDGQENAISTFLVPKLEEVQNNIVLDGHVYSVNTVIISEQWYQSLPDDLKAAVQQAAKVSLTVNRGLTVSNEIMGMEYLRENGVEIYAPTLEEKRQFQEATKDPAIDWLKEQIDPAWVDGIIEAVAEAEKKLGYN
jgi:C4-dicarboxylate-binding protein DctP